MKRDDIIWRLACLASLPFQEKYVIGGTADEYISANDLFRDIFELELVLQTGAGIEAISEKQVKSVSSLIELLRLQSSEALGPDDMKAEDFHDKMRNGKDWKAIRKQASEVLQTFGVSAARLTVDEIDEMMDG